MTLKSAVSDTFLVLHLISEHKYTSLKEEFPLFGLYCNYHWDVMGITGQGLWMSKNFQLKQFAQITMPWLFGVWNLGKSCLQYRERFKKVA